MLLRTEAKTFGGHNFLLKPRFLLKFFECMPQEVAYVLPMDLRLIGSLSSIVSGAESFIRGSEICV